MASFRLLVLAFVREYWTAHDESPSYGEIAAGLGTNKTRVKDAVRSLERDALLLRAPGPRGLSLPSVRDEAIRRLRQLGFVVDEDVLAVHAPVTHSTLLPPPELTYPARGSKRAGDEDGQQAA